MNLCAFRHSACLFWVVVLFAGCDSKQAGLAWKPDHLRIDVKDGQQQVDIAFSFQNKTSQPIAIMEVISDCDCLVERSSEKRVFSPGESGEIRATFDCGTRLGKIQRKLLVRTDADPNSAVLTVDFDISTGIRISPERLQWDSNDSGEEKILSLKGHLLDFDIADVRCTGSAFAIRPMDAGGKNDYRIAIKPVSTGRRAASMLIVRTSIRRPPWNQLIIPLSIQ